MKLALSSIAVVIGAVGLTAQGAAAVEGAKFFRVAEVDGAWWFVGPDGEKVFSSGVNVVQPGPSRGEYDARRPAYAAFRHYPDTAAWAVATHDRLAKWGFNTIGGWSAPEVTHGRLPYVAVLHLGKELGVPWNDVLHPTFAQQIESLVNEQVKPRADDPLLVGWCTDNELEWFPDTLLSFHIAQPAEQETRKALVRLLRDHYADDFGRLRDDFQPVDAESFADLERGGRLLLRPGGRAVELADRFTGLIARHFYQTTHDAIRRCDPNHLILGDRYHGFCPDVVAEAAAPYVDVITTNYDQPDWTDGRLPAHYLERLHGLTRKPVLVTEYYAAARENRSGNKNTGNIFTTLATQLDRAEAVRTRLAALGSLPFVVGAHWFQFADEPTFGRRDGEDYNFGLVDVDDRPYEELVAAFSELHEQLPALHAVAGRQTSPTASGPFVVPAAVADPLGGIAAWDKDGACVPCDGPSALGDLLVSWGPGHMYVALSCSNFVDATTYVDQRPGENEQLVWHIALDDSRPLRIGFGVDDKISVSDPAVACRLHQRGLRYTVITAWPAERCDRESLQAGDRVRLVAKLADPRRDSHTTWTRQLECGAPLREALTQPTPGPR